MRRTWGTRLVSLVIAGAMIASVPLGAFADEYCLDKGDIEITAKDDGNYVKQENNDNEDIKNGTKKDDDIKIKDHENDNDTSSVDHKVTIKSEKQDEAKVEIELDNVNIKHEGDNSEKGESAIEVESGDKKIDLTIKVTGENTIENGSITVNGNDNLTIQGDGKLTVDAGDESKAAAIGTSAHDETSGDDYVGTIKITGGVSVDATGGGKGGAGIGTGAATSLSNEKDEDGNNTGNGGSIVIDTTGSVTAKGGENAAGIGTGKSGKDKSDKDSDRKARGEIAENAKIEITSNGNTITATGGTGAAGIGTGTNLESKAVAETEENQKDSSVTFKNRLKGSISVLAKDAGNIIANGGVVLKKGTLGTSGAGIGTGALGGISSDGSIGVTADGLDSNISATGYAKSSGIGTGGGPADLYTSSIGSNVVLDGNIFVKALQGGVVKAESKIAGEGSGEGYRNSSGAGIGAAGNVTENGHIYVEASDGGNVDAIAGNGAAIGSGEAANTKKFAGMIDIVVNNLGKVIATSGKGDNNGSYQSAAIGSAGDFGGKINISGKGGLVEATGLGNGGAIGAGAGELTSEGVVTIGGNVNVKADTNAYNATVAAIGAGESQMSGTVIIKDDAVVTAYGSSSFIYSAEDDSESVIPAAIGTAGVNDGVYNGTVKILNNAKVLLGWRNMNEEDRPIQDGYIGSGISFSAGTAASDGVGTRSTDGTNAQYIVDCTATIAGISERETAKTVEKTFRESMTTKVWKWGEDYLGKYIHFTPTTETNEDGSAKIAETKPNDGKVSYTNNSLTINCHDAQQPQPEQPIDQTNTGVIRSDDPVAAQRWYWVTALLDADENVGYTYQQIGSNLTVTADEAAQAAVLHVLLSGWAEHTDVQSITFVTAGKTTTLYASEMLGITTGEQLTLTHDYDKATLAVEGRDYTYLLGEQAA